MFLTLISTVLIAASAVLITPTMSVAKDYKVGSLGITQPWARATPKGAKVGGGYLSITNTGAVSDKLLGGSLNDASRIEIQEMKMENSIMKMRAVPSNSLEIKPGERVTLKPGGLHLMFMDLKAF